MAFLESSIAATLTSIKLPYHDRNISSVQRQCSPKGEDWLSEVGVRTTASLRNDGSGGDLRTSLAGT